MHRNLIRNTRIYRLAVLVLFTCCVIQLPAGAQSAAQANEITKTGATALVGLMRGDTLRFTAFNPETTGERGDPIRLQMKLYGAQGNVIAESATVMIPPGEFRSVDFHRDDLPLAGEPGTGLLQVRTQALWGIRSLNRINVTTSLEVTGGNTAAGTFKFFINVEALP